MDYRAGDTVMHRVHGLGRIVRREKRDVLGERAPYYVVNVNSMTVWVPDDDNLRQQLRPPSGRIRFKRVVALISKPGEPLPSDRRERKELLATYLADGSIESSVRIIRALLAYGRAHSLNDNDQHVMLRVQSALLAEWSHVMVITPDQAQGQLDGLLRNVSGKGPA